ncbi:MAG: CBS domain-containing protein [Gammaproteobacteria bacterium]
MRQMPTMIHQMHPFPWAVEVSITPEEALAEMDKHAIHHLPVKQGNQVIGLVSALQLTAPPSDPQSAESLAPYCREGTPMFQTYDTLDKVLGQMIAHNQDAVLIMKEQKLAGIYTGHDAITHLHKLLNELYPQGDDAA